MTQFYSITDLINNYSKNKKYTKLAELVNTSVAYGYPVELPKGMYERIENRINVQCNADYNFNTSTYNLYR